MSEENTPVYDTAKILEALPHRYPMLLVDRVVSISEEEGIHAVKAVSFNEGFFQGHFPGRPIMPGVLQIEALAQAAGILAIENLGLAGTRARHRRKVGTGYSLHGTATAWGLA